MRKLIGDKNILVRGLAHPVVTGAGDGDFINKLRDKTESGNNQVRIQNVDVLLRVTQQALCWATSSRKILYE